MIIRNGYITFLQATGGGLDPVTGHPTVATESEMGSPIPCQFQSVSLNYLAKSNGEAAIKANYTILIENHNEVLGERLVLKRDDGTAVGTFSVIRIEPLDAVCEIRITV